MMTKFNSIENDTKGRYAAADRRQFQRSRVKSLSRTVNLVQVANEDQSVGGPAKQRIRDYLKKEKLKRGEKDEQYEAIYKREINEFKTLY